MAGRPGRRRGSWHHTRQVPEAAECRHWPHGGRRRQLEVQAVPEHQLRDARGVQPPPGAGGHRHGIAGRWPASRRPGPARCHGHHAEAGRGRRRQLEVRVVRQRQPGLARAVQPLPAAPGAVRGRVGARGPAHQAPAGPGRGCRRQLEVPRVQQHQLRGARGVQPVPGARAAGHAAGAQRGPNCECEWLEVSVVLPRKPFDK
mmetsp:Transcript_46952/g.132422  ORF Transcript_46952/g.132422 Transcript_46952/m.132422 type:complete len:202 (-) Transcript_46952:262-867(-)